MRAILPYLRFMALLARLLDRLARPAEEIRAENLQTWAQTLPGTCRIAEVEPRKRCRVVGVITNVRIDPRQGGGAIEATVSDGTGRLVSRWLGRSSMRGIRLGIGLLLEGTPSLPEEGETVMLNPEYELLPGPEQG
jgi:hypothetical protein